MSRNFIQITLEERRCIEQMLKRRLSVTQMAKELKRSPQTISRELKRNRIPKEKAMRTRMSHTPNNCVQRTDCWRRGLCGNACKTPGIRCTDCDLCNDVCPDFVNNPCHYQRDRVPWVCNSCPVTQSCWRKKYYYRANAAQKKAQERKVEARRGVTLSEDEIQELSDLFSPRLKKGQSIHSIYTTEIDRMPCCEKTIYMLVDRGFFDADNLDLQLKLRRKPPKRKPQFKVDKKCYLDRTYADFLTFKKAHLGLSEVQMDTVVGPLGTSRKALLTLYWPQANFLLVYLLDDRRSANVISVFKMLRTILSQEQFKRLFPVLLTDRGSEFTNPSKIEAGLTRLFYCDPQQPQQKGALEQEHTMIRQIIPKGKSFDHLRMEDILLLNSHITSYIRPGLGDRTPQEIFEYLFDLDVLKTFGLKRIPPEQVVLNTTLLPGFTGPTLKDKHKLFSNN